MKHETFTNYPSFRWLYLSWRVEKHYALWAQLGMLPVNRHHDEAMLDRVWRGIS